ncbi:MAG: TIGR00730 family Rossman fold protein [Wenzhouxiangellaceae bacterium]
MQRVCIYCGSSMGANAVYEQAARELVAAMAERGLGVVYGGARVGLMGVVAEAALAADCEVIGVIPRSLQTKEIAHDGLSRLEVVGSMHERKARMVELADGFIALPGGAGTMDELFEVFTWAQLGFHRAPCGLLNVAGYYDGIAGFVNKAVEQAFIRPQHRELLLIDDQADRLLSRFAEYQPPQVPKWINRDEL